MSEQRQKEHRERCWVREMTNALLQTIRPSASSHHHHHYKYHPRKWVLGYLCFESMNQTATGKERMACLLSLYSYFANKV